jgi:hypothetical protein
MLRQTEIHLAGPLVPEPSVFEFEMAFDKVKKDTNQQVLIKSQQNLLQQEVEQFVLRSINLVILLVTRGNSRSCGRGQSLYLLIGRVIKQTVALIRACHFYQLLIHTKFYPTSCCQV